MTEPEAIEAICDDMRHVACRPFTLENLHAVAVRLRIHRCWFHNDARHPHYDMPIRRIFEITAKCTLVSARELLAVVKR